MRRLIGPRANDIDMDGSTNDATNVSTPLDRKQTSRRDHHADLETFFEEKKRAEVMKKIHNLELDPVDASQELQDNEWFIDQMIEIDGLFLQLASERIQSQLELGRKACLKNYLAYEFAKSCQDDEKTTLTLIEAGHYEILRFSSPRLRAHHPITNLAIEKSLGAFLYLDPSLRGFEMDFDPVTAAEKNRDNKDFFLATVKNNGLFLEHGSREIQQDLDIGKAAVSENWRALEFAYGCQEDKRFVMELLDKQGLALRYAPSFKKNLSAACRAVDNNFAAILYVDPSIRAEVLSLLRVCCRTFHGWYSSVRAAERIDKSKRSQAGTIQPHIELLQTRNKIIQVVKSKS